MINVAEKLRPFQLKQQETITPDDLPRLLELSREVARTPRTDTAVRPRGQWLWVRWVGLAALVGLLAVAVSWRVRRRLRDRLDSV
jgi:hypothetical protein